MNPEQHAIRRNPALLCVFHALQSSLFPIAVISIFWRDDIGLSLTEAMVTQALFGVVVAVLEFPSGYLADRIGYRRSLIIGSGIVVFGWIAYVFAGSLLGVILAEALLGVGFSLLSGTDSALLFESLKAQGREGDFRLWFGRMRFFGQLSEGTSALFAGLLYATHARLPFVIEVGLWTIAAFALVMLREPAGQREVVKNHGARVRQLVRYALVDNVRLRALLLVAVAFGLASFVPVWLIQLYAVDSGVPVAWLGPIWAIANYVVALGSLSSDRLGKRFGLLPLLVGCGGLIAVGYFGLGLSHFVYGFVFYYALTLVRGVTGPLITAEEQVEIPSSDRASLLSFRSLMFRLVFVVVGPAVGASVDEFGQHPVLLVTGASITGLVVVAAVVLGRTSERRAGIAAE